MDFQWIETLLGLPEFRVTGQIIRPHGLDLHLERRETSLLCPHCQGCCARIKEGRDRCIRDLPILDRPVTLWLHLRRFKCTTWKVIGWTLDTSKKYSFEIKALGKDLCATPL